MDEALYQKALQEDSRAIELWYKRIEAWNVQNQQGDSHITIIIPPVLLPLSESPEGNELRIIEMKSGKAEIINDEEEEPCI